jgi:TRAP-type C4-dicarboxylate transport system substrate-binding protein
MQVVKEAGVEIVRPDKSSFVEAVQPLYDQYKENQPRVYDLLQRIRNYKSSDES